MNNSIDCKLLESMLLSAANNLQNNKKLINDYNVFPVPDGDTGTNMSLTFSGAVSSISTAKTDDAGKLLSSLATAALRNARGNSGVILSQILRGVSKGTEGAKTLGVEEIKKAAMLGRDVAYRAVMKPTEGTILTVVRNIAEFAEKNAGDFDDVLEFMKALLTEAERSLESTKEILPILKQAGVVDAGGKGVVTLLEGAAYTLETGKVIELSEGDSIAFGTQVKEVKTEAEIKFLYCTEFLINKKKDRKAKQFTSAISDKGDCMLVIEDDDIVKVHIHTNHPGFVIEQALKLGELTNLKIDNMKYQHSENISNAEEEVKEEVKEYGFVAVSAGEGLSEVFKSLGADEIVQGGQTMNPSTQDLLDAVGKVNAKNVFILPNNKNIIMAAEQVVELSDKNIIVIPTRNIPQGISAMISFSAETGAEENKKVMSDATKEVFCGQLTFAARDTELDGVKINEGDIMGLTDKGGIEVVGSDLDDCCLELIQKLVTDDSGVITLYYGEGVTKESAEELKERLENEFFEQDVQIIYGGQPVYYYIISVE